MIGNKIRYQVKTGELHERMNTPVYEHKFGLVVDAYSKIGSNYMPNGSTLNHSNRVYVVETASKSLVDVDRSDVLFIVHD